MLLLSTSSLKWYWLHKIFKIAKQSGYLGLDLVIDRSNFDSFDAEYVLELKNTFWLEILSITWPEAGLTKKEVDQIMDMAKTLNAQVVNFFPMRSSDKTWAWLDYLKKVKRKVNIWVTLQNVEQKYILFVIPEYKNANLLELKKITWNTALNLSALDPNSGISISKAQAMLWNTIRNIYLNDRRWPKWGLLPWGTIWWTSHLPIESFLMKLKAAGYNWFFSLKVRPSELWAWNDGLVLDNLERVRNYYNQHYEDYKP